MHGRFMRLSVLGVVTVVVVAGCGQSTLTLAEYANATEALVIQMGASFADIDSEWVGGEANTERAAVYWEGRLRIRDDFLADIEALDAPAEARDFHEQAIDVFTRITEADHELADRVSSFDTLTRHWQWTTTPESQAVDDLLEEVFAFCREVQTAFDAMGTTFGYGPWGEVTEAVNVAFRCTPG